LSCEVLGEPFISLVLPASHARVERMLSRALRGRGEAGVQVTLRCPEGRQLLIGLSVGLHQNVAGDVLGVLAVGQLLGPERAGDAQEAAPDSPSTQLVLPVDDRDEMQAIDLNQVRMTVGGSEAVMIRLLENFHGHSQASLEEMRRAVEQCDWEMLKRDAHSLKGSCGYVAAKALKASAEALERSATESMQGPVFSTPPAEALALVEKEMARVLAVIEQVTIGTRADSSTCADSSTLLAAAPTAAAPPAAHFPSEQPATPAVHFTNEARASAVDGSRKMLHRLFQTTLCKFVRPTA